MDATAAKRRFRVPAVQKEHGATRMPVVGHPPKPSSVRAHVPDVVHLPIAEHADNAATLTGIGQWYGLSAGTKAFLSLVYLVRGQLGELHQTVFRGDPWGAEVVHVHPPPRLMSCRPVPAYERPEHSQSTMWAALDRLNFPPDIDDIADAEQSGARHQLFAANSSVSFDAHVVVA